MDYEIKSTKDLIEFWKKFSELFKIKEDKLAWLYIKMTQYSNNKKYKKDFNDAIKNIESKSQPYVFKLNKKFYESPFRQKLPQKYQLLNKIISNQIELFREKNIPLFEKEQKLAVKFREIVGKMEIDFEGKKLTVQQMSAYLENHDREIREKAWRAIWQRFAKDQNKLNKLFDELKAIRVQIAKNAGFKNYRDFVHQAKGRFNYTPQDLENFHRAVKKTIVPLIKKINKKKAGELGIKVLKPWDVNVDVNLEDRKLFNSTDELIQKSQKILNKVDKEFGDEFSKMIKNNLIDAENRKNKAPGGYCYPIFELDSSFIFMHAVGKKTDIRTLLHEAGHAMHNVAGKEIEFIEYIYKPQEIAELASTSMELITLEYWDEFFKKDEMKDLIRNELWEKVVAISWIVVVDKFQHWIYLKPNHTQKERDKYFSKLLDEYGIEGDWDGLEKQKAIRWMKQLHIFEVPFYYIEYAMAQLGALAIYRNYKKNPKKTIAQYKKFLKTAYAKPLPEVYKTAGIKFDLSQEYIADLMEFVKGELEK